MEVSREEFGILISRGAEALIFRKDNKIIKYRFPRKYRIKEIDEKLRKQRTRLEVRIMKKLLELGIPVPNVIDYDEKRGTIIMEYIDGIKLRDYLDKLEEEGKIEEIKNIFVEIGRYIGKMHRYDIIHNDLTTSNILMTKDKKLYIIDFGLSFFSGRLEDKAVDIHLLKEALESRHPKIKDLCFSAFLEGYKEENNKWEFILKKLEEIEKRGRYKERGE